MIEFSCVALSCFDLSRLAIFLDARMLVKPVAQGSSVLNVVGQETCAWCDFSPAYTNFCSCLVSVFPVNSAPSHPASNTK